jgi:medium-chain acyl-[acyl-carrier-protein] hydrolase
MASGRRAAHLPPKRFKHHLPDDEFIDELKRLNGTPPDVFKTPELLELMLPILRNDFMLADGYVAAAPVKLPCPIVAFGGDADADVGRRDLEAWRELTAAAFRLHMLVGDHFFINSRQSELIGLVAAELQHLAR